ASPRSTGSGGCAPPAGPGPCRTPSNDPPSLVMRSGNGGRGRRARRRDYPALQVATGHHGHERVDLVLLGGERPSPLAPGGQPTLPRLARRPVLAIGDVPELRGVGRVEAVALPGLRGDQPGALHEGLPRPERLDAV